MRRLARAQVSERVLGLEAGADDTWSKPFEVAEFVARVHALARRAAGHGRIRCGEPRDRPLERQAFVGGRPPHAYGADFAPAPGLATCPGRVVKRSDLQSSVWESAFDSGSNFIEVHMSRLRAKLEESTPR